MMSPMEKDIKKILAGVQILLINGIWIVLFGTMMYAAHSGVPVVVGMTVLLVILNVTILSKKWRSVMEDETP